MMLGLHLKSDLFFVVGCGLERTSSDGSKTAIARCYLSKAKEEDDEQSKIDLLVQARYWDFLSMDIQKIAYPLAKDLDQRGQKSMNKKTLKRPIDYIVLLCC